MRELLLATGNQHKIQEITAMLADLPSLKIVSLQQFATLGLPEETGTTMAENAALKAHHCARETGLLSLADDSGIEVDALGGEPGVRSARWVTGTDAARTQALLSRMQHLPDEQRTARYRCAICLAMPTEEQWMTEGTCEGSIARVTRGLNGFGYDPIFEINRLTGCPDEWIGCTMAEVPPWLKANVSHRARAVRAIKTHLATYSG